MSWLFYKSHECECTKVLSGIKEGKKKTRGGRKIEEGTNYVSFARFHGYSILFIVVDSFRISYNT